MIEISLPVAQRQRMLLLFVVSRLRGQQRLPDLHEVPVRHPVPLREHTASLPSAASDGPPSRDCLDSASRSRFPRWKIGEFFQRIAIENPMLQARFAFRPWQASHSAEMHREGQGGRVAKMVELVDLYWDGEPRERFSTQAAIVAVPAKWQACHFPGAKESLVVGEGTVREGVPKSGAATRSYCTTLRKTIMKQAI